MSVAATWAAALPREAQHFPPMSPRPGEVEIGRLIGTLGPRLFGD
jgi:hypothetical protein